MSKVVIIDRDEERRLLDNWFETTSFDKTSKGIPKIEDDEDEDDDETKSFGFELESKVRHVRTPAGARRYGQPIGTIIVAGSPLRNLTIRDRVFTGWERVSDSRGNDYDVGKRGNRWIATRAGEWDELEWGGSADEVFRALDARAGRSGGTAVPRPRATPAPAASPAAPLSGKRVNYTREESDDPNYEKYKGADGKTYWAVQDPQSREWVLLDDDDTELDSAFTKAALLKKLHARAAAPDAPAAAPARTPRAARVTPAPASVTPVRPPVASVSADGLDEMSLTELRTVARSEMSTGSKLGTRESLIGAIRKHRANQNARNTKPITGLPDGYNGITEHDGAREIITVNGRGPDGQAETYNGYRTDDGGWIAYREDEHGTGWTDEATARTPGAAVAQSIGRQRAREQAATPPTADGRTYLRDQPITHRFTERQSQAQARAQYIARGQRGYGNGARLTPKEKRDAATAVFGANMRDWPEAVREDAGVTEAMMAGTDQPVSIPNPPVRPAGTPKLTKGTLQYLAYLAGAGASPVGAYGNWQNILKRHDLYTVETQPDNTRRHVPTAEALKILKANGINITPEQRAKLAALMDTPARAKARDKMNAARPTQERAAEAARQFEPPTDAEIERGQRSGSSTMRNISGHAAERRATAVQTTGRETHVADPKNVERFKPHQLRIGMMVRGVSAEDQVRGDTTPRWHRIGMIANTRERSWSRQQMSRSGGMYVLVTSDGHELTFNMSPNDRIDADPSVTPTQDSSVKPHRLEGILSGPLATSRSQPMVLVPSAQAIRDYGLPEPQRSTYGEILESDPNYGRHAQIAKMREQADLKPINRPGALMQAREYMDREELAASYTFEMHNTSDAARVEYLQKRIEQLRPGKPLMSINESRSKDPFETPVSAPVSAATIPSANSSAAQRAERSMNRQMATAQDTEQRAAAARAQATQPDTNFDKMTNAQIESAIASGNLSDIEEQVARRIMAARAPRDTSVQAFVDTNRVPLSRRLAARRRAYQDLNTEGIVEVFRIAPAAAADAYINKWFGPKSRYKNQMHHFDGVVANLVTGTWTPQQAADAIRRSAKTAQGMEYHRYIALAADLLDGKAAARLAARGKAILSTEVKDFISGFEVKAVRYVRTPSGAQRFGQPIGSIIVRDGASPLSSLRAVAGNRLQGSDGKRYKVGMANGKWEAREEGGSEAVVRGDSQEQVLTRLNAHAADNESGSGPSSGDSGASNAPTRQNDKDHAEHGEAYKGADGKIYYIKGEDDDYVIRDKDGNVIGKKRDKGEALKELERFVSSSTGAGPAEEPTPAPSGGNGNGSGPPNAPSGGAPSGAGGANGPAPNTPANQQAIARQLARQQTAALRGAAQRNGMPNAANAPREGIIAWLLKFLIRKMLGNEQQATQNTAAYGALLELKEALEALEAKRGVVRTAAGAARYGVPIGTPIPTGGKPRLGAGIASNPKPKMASGMREHRDGFKRLHARLIKKPETQGMAGSVMSLVEQINEGEIQNEDQLMGVVARLFTPDQFGTLLANMKSLEFATEVKTLIDVKADKEAHTGAMIALIPTRADARRLADQEGEDQDELHVTLAFLGKAADISESARYAIIGRIAGLAGAMSRPGAEAFAVNVFNPSGDEPCVVMGINGKGPALNDLHNHTMMALGDVESGNNWHMPDQHSPWIPHITLRYFPDGELDADWLMQQFDKTGPVEFDRIRVAFGGNNIDFPLYEGMVKGDEEKRLVITPGGRVGDDSSHNVSPRENWVEKRGGLPPYIRTIRNGIMEKQGKDEDSATALAIAAVKRWASGRGNVSPKVRTAAAAAVAQWEAMKGTKGIGSGLSGAGGSSSGVGAAPAAKKPSGNYVNDRMAEGGRIAGAARQSMSRDGAFNDKHPRGRGAQGGQFVRKNGDTASSLSNAMKKRLPIAYGQQGPVVKQVQILVGKMGFPTEEDGIFGEKTKAAVKAAQKKLGLKPTGVIDEETFTALMSNAKPSKRKR